MTDVSAPPRAGRPKSEAKAEAIMDAAAKLFLSQGFQGTSMDAVAKQAGVSKQTVYSHYANKEELFKAVITAKVASYGFDEAAMVEDEDLRSALLTVTRRFVDLLFDPKVVAMHRVVMGEAVSQPRVASLFYESGPLRTKASVCAFLERQVAKDRLCIPVDSMLYAATQLLNTAIGLYQLQLMLGLRESVDETELGAHLDRVVDDFLTLYRA
ncbi:MAG: TetR/AcrR family transcriptional regulator [Candidatus Thiodiazotropha sp.]|jgi:TetR/AcrR family transcriptional repressor of mexJK operon